MLLRCERQCAFSVDLSKIFLLNIFTVHILAGKKKNINQVKTIKTAVYFMFVTKSNLLFSCSSLCGNMNSHHLVQNVIVYKGLEFRPVTDIVFYTFEN